MSVDPLTASPEGNREGWLTELGRLVAPLYATFRPGPYRLTYGWPCKGALGRGRRRVGECHAPQSSKAGIHELFISPCLAEPLQVAGTVCHEIAHVAAGVEAAHGRGFITVCRHVGLTKGKPTSVMPGARLEERLHKLLEKLGPYPHSALEPVGKVVVRPKSVVTLQCSACDCKITIAVKWLDLSGPPTCGCGTTMAPVERED